MPNSALGEADPKPPTLLIELDAAREMRPEGGAIPNEAVDGSGRGSLNRAALV